MLSFSYRSFLIMDQLRRRAGISVPQLLYVLPVAISAYGRISKRVYGGDEGVLLHDTEVKVLHALRILLTGYVTNVLSVTSIKQSYDISDVLLVIEQDLIADDPKILIDCDLETLMSAANKVLNT